MLENPFKIRFYFLLVVYGMLVLLDAWFLYKGQYNLRVITKLTALPLLGIWFYANTSSKKLVAPNTFQARFIIYIALILLFVSDKLSLNYENLICYEACLILYTFIYLAYIFLVINLQKSISLEEKYLVYLKLWLPAFILMTVFSLFFLRRIIDDWWIFYEVMVGIHAFVIILLFSVVMNAFGEKEMRPIWMYLVAAVFFLLLANVSYGISDLIYFRRHRILDVPVAIGNGLSQALMFFAVIKFVLLKWETNEISLDN